MATETQCLGLMASDVCVRTALIVGLQELRAAPDLIDLAFAWLIKDELTEATYGQNEADRARQWFCNNDVPIVAGRRIEPADLPCVSITMLRDTETRNTLDDRHYNTWEYRGGWPNLTEPFTPTAYSTTTGEMVLPSTITLVLAAGQVLVDRLGRTAVIREVLAARTLRIDRGAALEVSGVVIRGRFPPRAITLRNAYFEESLLVGCHAMGDQSQVIWLYTLVKFTLLRIRRRLLEGRGLENTSISGSDLKAIDYLDTSSQPGFARYLTVQGMALNVWPDDEAEVIESAAITFSFSPAGGSEMTGFLP